MTLGTDNKRYRIIDDSTRPDHCYLDETDVCIFIGEYTPKGRESYSYSETNQLISNLKKSMDKRGSPEWYWKENAIRKAAGLFRGTVKKDADVTFVPVPPSKAKSDPAYDDRMLKILNFTCMGWKSPDVRELIMQKVSTHASHLSVDDRLSVDDLLNVYVIDESLAQPEPRTILIVDDVLTTGAHFKAMKKILMSRFPSVLVQGLFIARVSRVHTIEGFGSVDF